MLTPAGVSRMAARLRGRLSAGPERSQETPAAAEGSASSEARPEGWQSDAGTRRVTVVRTSFFNRHLIGCRMEGVAGMVNVRVRSADLYRAGELIDVRLNDVGEWEAAVQRVSNKWGGRV